MEQFVISKCNSDVYVNEYRIESELVQGNQGSSFIVDKNFKKYVLQMVQNNKQNQNRVTLQLKLNKLPHVVKMIEYSTNIIVLEENQHILKSEIGDKMIVIYEYIPYKSIDQQTFKLNVDKNNILVGNELKQALTLFKQIVATVKQLHQQNIFHFDIKPENILASIDNYTIIDFGSVPEQISQPTQVYNCLINEEHQIAFNLNTTPTFSPVKYDSHDRMFLCSHFDVYSLGCVLYYILTNQYLTGHIKFDSMEFQRLLFIYNPAIADLISGMTQRFTLLRYSIDNILNHPVFQDLEMTGINYQSYTIRKREQSNLENYLHEQIRNSIIRLDSTKQMEEVSEDAIIFQFRKNMSSKIKNISTSDEECLAMPKTEIGTQNCESIKLFQKLKASRQNSGNINYAQIHSFLINFECELKTRMLKNLSKFEDLKSYANRCKSAQKYRILAYSKNERIIDDQCNLNLQHALRNNKIPCINIVDAERLYKQKIENFGTGKTPIKPIQQQTHFVISYYFNTKKLVFLKLIEKLLYIMVKNETPDQRELNQEILQYEDESQCNSSSSLKLFSRSVSQSDLKFESSRQKTWSLNNSEKNLHRELGKTSPQILQKINSEFIDSFMKDEFQFERADSIDLFID